MSNADLRGTDLTDADLRGADFTGTDVFDKISGPVYGLTVAQLRAARSYEGALLPSALQAELDADGPPTSPQ